MRLYAPAKINWTLEVLGRPDSYGGYHEVRTVLQTIDLCDIIEIAPAKGLRLKREGERGASAADDLVLKAARLLREECGYRGGAAIRLTKSIPVAAGLGGGSSDAAATLRGLNAMWNLHLSQGELATLAARLGSDVPFFIYGGTALAEGRGERITPLPEAPTAWLVILVPPLSLADKTAHMYKSLSEAAFSDGSFTQQFLQRLRQQGLIDERFLYNAFEQTAYAVFPELARYRSLMLEAGARRAHLAGSGPALFAISDQEKEARRLAYSLRVTQGCVFVARSIGSQAALRMEP